jgi:hypothetical protein
MTVFHRHNERQPLDPSRMFHTTQTDPLPPGPLIDPICFDGKRKTITYQFSKLSNVREQVRAYGPVYDVQHDSPVLKARAQEVHLDTNEKRPELWSLVDSSSTRAVSSSRPRNHIARININSGGCGVGVHTSNKIKTPTIRQKIVDNEIYDKSCYVMKPSKQNNITPSQINKEARSRLFKNIAQHISVKQRQQYVSQEIGSKFADRIKQNSLA